MQSSRHAASEASAGGPVKVVFVVAWGRSGSTLLGDMLGQHDGFFHGGELHYVWERGVIEDWTCGCGCRFAACPAWSPVLSRLREEAAVDAQALMNAGLSLRTRHLPQMLTGGSRARLRARLQPYLDVTERLYRSLRDVTGSRVIVDSSKIPAHAYALSLIPSISLHVVHLVRDPRATAYSWSFRGGGHADRPADRPMARHSALESALRWNSWNLAAEVFTRALAIPSVIVRYEDFVTAPQLAVDRILAMAGEPRPPLAFSSAGEIDMTPCHTISGNPSRLRTGKIRGSADDEWRRSMPRSSRALVTALTWPLMLRHGYA